MSFEKLVSELEDTVKNLGKPDVGLDESIELFTKGMDISRQCIAILNESKGKITKLTEEMGKLIEVETDIK